MNNYTLNKHEFEIQKNVESNSFRIQWVDVLKGNQCLSFLPERRKIYLVVSKSEILYVGEAHSSVKKRFQRGCISYNYFLKTKKARGGYKGYKWLNDEYNKERNLTVYVATFSEEFDSKEQRNKIEAIEGELVYLTRKELGYWPKFQNEIHFENHGIAKTISIEIFESIRNKFN